MSTPDQIAREAAWTAQITGLMSHGMHFRALDLIRAALAELESQGADVCGSEEFYTFLSTTQREATKAIRKREEVASQ